VFLCLIDQAQRHEDVYESEGIARPFLISALDEGEWSASRSGRFTPGERSLGTHWIGGLVGNRVGMDTVENRKIIFPLPRIEPMSCSPESVTILTEP
jgi:hypothetical protein